MLIPHQRAIHQNRASRRTSLPSRRRPNCTSYISLSRPLTCSSSRHRRRRRFTYHEFHNTCRGCFAACDPSSTPQCHRRSTLGSIRCRGSLHYDTLDREASTSFDFCQLLCRMVHDRQHCVSPPTRQRLPASCKPAAMELPTISRDLRLRDAVPVDCWLEP